MTAVLLSFRYPSDDTLNEVRAILGKLAICDPPRFREPYTSERNPLRGGLDSVMAALTVTLRQDFDQNEQKCAEWNGSFDYRVRPSEFIDGAVEVMTRLHTTTDTEPRQGNIYYGRMVERVGADDFFLWVDDDPEE